MCNNLENEVVNFFLILEFFLLFTGQLIFIVFGPMVLKSKSTQKTNDIDAERIKTVFTIETEVSNLSILHINLSSNSKNCIIYSNKVP